MLFILTGKSCSGKDTIKRYLLKEYHIVFNNCITYTTRPKRKGEQDGVDYHFITNEKFEEMVKNGEFFETTSYSVANDEVWHYGTLEKDLLKAEDKDYIIIMNPNGAKKVKEELYYIPQKTIYIYANQKTIKQRMEERSNNTDENKRRIKADNNDFKNWEMEVDRIIYNNLNDDIEDVVNDIFEYMYRLNDR